MKANPGLLFVAAVLAAVCTIPAGAAPGPSGPQALVTPAIHDFADLQNLTVSATLRFPTGGYFYGSDCGGNSAMVAPTASPAANKAGGVILSGAAGQHLASDLTCDDRRNALGAYRDAFDGTPGQAHAWRNPNGGAAGGVTLVGRYQSGGLACINFRATARVSGIDSARSGAACRQSDGNWHTL